MGDPTVLTSYYKAFFQELQNRGVEVIAELYHFDMPVTLQDSQGWLNESIIAEFVAYADDCMQLLNDVVSVWVPIALPYQEVGRLRLVQTIWNS